MGNDSLFPSLLMLINLPFWEAVLLDATQNFQNTAFGRAGETYACPHNRQHDQNIDRLHALRQDHT